jgi:hypothetical protein
MEWDLQESVIRLDITAQALNPDLQNRLLVHFQTCKTRIDAAIADVESAISRLIASQIPPWSTQTPFSCTALSSSTLRFLDAKGLRLQDKFLARTARALSDRLRFLFAASAFASQLISRPDFVLLPIDRITAPLAIGCPKLDAVKRAFTSTFSRIAIVPDPGPARIRSLLRDAISAGIAARKPGISYFPELPMEDFLARFFASAGSPLRALLP